MLVEGPCEVGVHQLKGNEGNEGNNKDENSIDENCKEDKQDEAVSRGYVKGYMERV